MSTRHYLMITYLIMKNLATSSLEIECAREHSVANGSIIECLKSIEFRMVDQSAFLKLSCKRTLQDPVLVQSFCGWTCH